MVLYLKTFDLIVGEVGLFIDLLEVNVSVRICLSWRKNVFTTKSHCEGMKSKIGFSWEFIFEFTSHDWMR